MSMTSLQVLATFSYSQAGRRPIQEDHVLMLREKGIFLVADGFGGKANVKLPVAQVACEGVQQFLLKEGGDQEATLPFVLRNYFSLVGNVLYNAFLFANQKLNASNQSLPIQHRAGASVLGAYLDGHLLALASVGLCQAWLFRQGQRKELVIPRSLGRLKDPFAKDAPEELRVPLMAMGMSQVLEPEIFEVELCPGDWVLLATDGLLSDALDQLVTLHLEYVHELRNSKTGWTQLSDRLKESLGKWDYPENVAMGLILL
jgi:serine/threonine protein phosphatase PrpC